MQEKDLRVIYKHVFGTEYGKKVLADISDKINFLGTGFPFATNNETKQIDVHQILRREGQREIFLYIIEKLGAEPDEVIEMARESDILNTYDD